MLQRIRLVRGRAIQHALFSSSTHDGASSAGIFVDAENLGSFLKADGARQLVESASEFGNPIVRKAYGNWANPGVSAHQHSLVANGFQLIHTPHPIKQKSAADLAMVVDVMATQQRMPDLDCFVLATGDSDFSHLFCHLRQAGRKVVGVGPKSVLSEIVKNTADRFIYVVDKSESSRVSTTTSSRSAFAASVLDHASMPDALALLDRAMRNIRVDDDGAVNPGLLKEQCLVLDSAFDERQLGFRGFVEFLRASRRFNIVDKGPGVVRAFHMPDGRNSAAVDDEAIALLERVSLSPILTRSFDTFGYVNPSLLKDQCLLRDPRFSEERFGFSNFKDFLHASNLFDIVMSGQQIQIYPRGKSPSDGDEVALFRSAVDMNVFRSTFQKCSRFWLCVGIFRKSSISPLVDDTGTLSRPRVLYEIDMARLEQSFEEDDAAFPIVVEAIDAILIWDAKVHCAMEIAAAKRTLTPYLKGSCAVDDLAFTSMWELVEDHPNTFVRTSVEIMAAFYLQHDEPRSESQDASAGARESAFVTSLKTRFSMSTELLISTCVELRHRASELDAESLALPRTLSEWRNVL
jgi:uncharacterized LabA/DUF88 family protein